MSRPRGLRMPVYPACPPVVLSPHGVDRRWTFAAHDSTRARILYVTIQVGAAVLASLLVVFFVRVVGMGHVGAYLAAIPLVTVCSFAANRLWTFADRD
ncbi:MAG: hypothetical protein EXQ81_01920 [Thermoleophilia bacterium]|nr:hypothetical protein [Thermoleophilia bacterium]